MHTITRRFEFDAAHRILRHESKCRHIHGHRYVVEVTVSCESLDNVGRVLDFSEVKKVIGDWIDDKWDHNIILSQGDPLLDIPPASSIWSGRRPFIMSNNPTVENMVTFLHGIASDLLRKKNKNLKLQKVRLYETPNCWADYPPA